MKCCEEILREKRVCFLKLLRAVGCLLFLILLGGCGLKPSSIWFKSVEFQPYSVDGENEWNKPGFEGNAWVVLVDDFYGYGSIPPWMFWSIANVGPYKTTIYLNGTVIETLSGTGLAGKEIRYKEVWNIEERSPYPATHPIRHLRGANRRGSKLPTALLVLTDTDERKVQLFPIDVLSKDKQLQAWRYMLSAAIRNRKDFAGFYFVGGNGSAIENCSPFKVLTLNEAETHIADLINQGRRIYFSSWFADGGSWLEISWE